MDKKDIEHYLLPFSTVKKIMKKTGHNLWLPKDTVNLMRELAEDYIRDMTAKAVLIARNSNIKYRIRKKDLELVGGIA
ncbi:MAG: NFYB/HAP3 family transcription factor subunit [Nanoarchaeota archaeon]|nr:NFYB/HAP3 family transcription factor subunit [Nanoarchaeota archaeon]MCG2717709.1 NFYB/HAP3 family transcription factor subunit [Nanoarchaeota archaeon]